jgi:hypothetical protein
MNKAAGKVAMAQLARVKRQQAALLMEEAQLFSQLAEGESVDIRTGRLRPSYTSTMPKVSDYSEAELAEARQALRASDTKRRIANK